MKNFDVYLRRSIRKEPVDWTEHYVDYEVLKQRLSSYQKRRKELGKLLQGGARLTLEEVQLVMADDASQGDYFQYMNDDEQRGETHVWLVQFSVAFSLF